MIKSIFPLVFLQVFFLRSIAQAPDTVYLRSQFEEALALSDQKEVTKAAALARRTLTALNRLDPPPADLLAGLHQVLGDCALESGDYSEALRRYRESEKIIADNNLGSTLLMADVLNKLGNYYRETKEFDQAEGLLRDALKIRESILGNWDLKVADTYINLGHCLDYIGDFEKALEFHRQALAIRMDLAPEDLPKIAQCYNNIGLCLDIRQDTDQALDAYRQALEKYAMYYGKDHVTVADVYLNIGNAYANESQIDSFIHYQTKALNIWLKAYPDKHPLVALAYNNLANAYDIRGQAEKARELFAKALKIRIDFYGNVHPDVAQIHLNTGLTHARNGDWQKAAASFAACQDALNYRPGEQAGFEGVNDPILLLQLLDILPSISINRYQDTEELSHLLRASSYFEQADLLIDHLRTRYQGTDSKLVLAETARRIYDFAIEITLYLANLTEDESYRKQAFQFSEKSKGLLLLEALKKAEAESFSGIPAEVISRLKTAEVRIGALEKERYLKLQNGHAPDAPVIIGLNKLIFEEKTLLGDLLKGLEQNYPQYYNLRYATSTPAIEWLQNSLLDTTQTIVEYFLGDNYLQIFLITADDFQTRSIQLPDDFFTTLKAMNSSVRNFPFVSSREYAKLVEQYAATGHKMYKYLIEPIAANLSERLIIIPDGVLGFLSFDMLLTNRPADIFNFKEYPYLMRRHAISYNYSTGLFKEMTEQESEAGLKTYLGFAPEFQPENKTGLSRLKFNEKEIKAIKRRMSGQTLTGPDATKANFLELQENYRILHLATHGKANNASADYSFLAFSETETTTGNEALLFVREIYNLSTEADLVVLSACETGTGELFAGEGIASIARSFSYAGAKSLIASLWSVDDEATSRLMQLFFRKIKHHLPKDVALQKAKLLFVDKGRSQEAHPFYWAAFISIGNMESISGWQSFHYTFWLAGILALLLPLAYFLRHRARNILKEKYWWYS